MKQTIVALCVVGMVAVFFACDLDRLLTLEQARSQVDALQAWKTAAPWQAMAAFFGVYVLVATLSLPGAAVLTLLAGAIFGLFWGIVLTSFASSLGATGAFLVARFVLREAVAARFGVRLAGIERGIARDGAFFLFALRLAPVVPFFVVNLLMGLTVLPARTFYWVSQAGMLAGTAVYVNAGLQLATLEGFGDVLSARLLVSFTLLGLFPWLARSALRRWRRRRVYAPWTRPRHFDRNLVVIGGGAAGLTSAYVAAATKASVTLVEAHEMGGDCLNHGCVPSKTLIKSSRLAYQLRTAGGYGVMTGPMHIDFKSVLARVRQVVADIAPHDSVARYKALGVDVVIGHARVVDPWTVDIALDGGGCRRLTTRAIVIATGARPVVPAIPGLDETGYVTSDTLWDTLATFDHAPGRVVVLGGGPIGCELAQALARLGSRVTQVEMGPRILGREDDDVAALASAALASDGVEILAEHTASRCRRDGEDKYLVVEHGATRRHLPFDLLICAVGREARLSGYGLESLAVETARTIHTDEYLETLLPNVYAAGDVAGPYQFTHTAAHQAWYATINALFGDVWRFAANYSAVPWTTFIDPEVARVGLNEQDALAARIPFDVTRFDFADLDRAITDGATRGFVKVLTVPGKDRILGASIVGPHAGELLAEFVLVMRWNLGLGKLLATVHAYPTFAEANKYVAGAWRRQHAPARILGLLRRYHTWRRH